MVAFGRITVDDFLIPSTFFGFCVFFAAGTSGSGGGGGQSITNLDSCTTVDLIGLTVMPFFYRK